MPNLFKKVQDIFSDPVAIMKEIFSFQKSRLKLL